MDMQTAFAKFGYENCAEAYRLNRNVGEGAKTIAQYFGVTTKQADCMINAWADRLDSLDRSDAGLATFNHNLIR